MTSGLNMTARYTFAAEQRRVADLGAASQAVGHSDLSTTASIYGHYDLTDLEHAMEAFASIAAGTRRAGRLKKISIDRL
jgi:integrase